jgi:HAD superfamily hydrolase (TIGR01509 family)
MKGIKNIIFDLGGVILNIDNKLTGEAFLKLGVRNLPEIFGHGHAASFVRAYEIGKISDEQFITEFKRLGSLTADDSAILDAWNALLLDFPPARIQLLKDLKKHYRLFLFSNTNSLHVAELKKRYRAAFGNQELDDLFEKSYYSQILGMRKPDAMGFQHIMKENDLEPGQTLFVDDALINVTGARAVGLQGFYLEPGKTILDIEWF